MDNKAQFNPTSIGLPESFHLTDYSKLKGQLTELLEGIGEGHIGMDCSVIPLRDDYFLISTTDFFYPLVEDPFSQGMIGCANVLSDLYAMGITKCDNMLMILASSLDMPPEIRKIVTRKLIEGFSKQASIAGTVVTGGQTILNPWPIIGGTAMSSLKSNEFILPELAEAGDVLVLTKPLGTQVAVNYQQWTGQNNQTYLGPLASVFPPEKGREAFLKAEKQMMRLNKNAASLMHKYGSHGATDVTGFGLMGHATNLVKNQRAAVNFEIHTFPVLEGMVLVDQTHNNKFKLMAGFSAETSGGLLVLLPASKAEDFCRELSEMDSAPAWIIGRVVPSSNRSQNHVILTSDLKILEV